MIGVLAAVVFMLVSVPNVARTQGMPCEPALAGVTTTCLWARGESRHRTRVIVTRPTEANRAKLPAVFFLPWLSCDPVTVTPTTSDGWQDVLRALIQRSGLIVARSEKPGLGGGGGACERLGYHDEVAAHRAALAHVRSMSEVDADSIFVFGGSMGGTIAALLASDSAPGIKGVLVAGTTGTTWLEHMIALDRRVMELRGEPAAIIHRLIPEQVRFHSMFLGEGRSPSQIASGWSGARAVWRRMIGSDTRLRELYGRPIRYHHEAQRSNWAQAWATVNAPILVLHGELDWIMPENEHLRILRSLSPQVLKDANFLKFPGMGHDFLVYPSLEESFHGRNGRFNTAVADTILSWLREQRQRGPRR